MHLGTRARLATGALALAVALSGCANRQLERFEATLAARNSATDGLLDWCAMRDFGDKARISALPASGPTQPEPADARSLLAIAPGEPLGYRHVQLVCGGRVLSDAHNWYVPGRLSPEMNTMLAATRTPFGTVVAPLHFRRERLASTRGASAGCPEGTILSHRALLRLPDGRPISLVVECYTAANLAMRQ